MHFTAKSIKHPGTSTAVVICMRALCGNGLEGNMCGLGDLKQFSVVFPEEKEVGEVA